MNSILLIDDESAILQMLNQYLKQYYIVKLALNGKTALNFIKQDPPDLIIVDWMLPDLSGPEIISWVRNNKSYKSIPIIMLTAKSSEQDKLKGFDSGADDYIVKPLLLSELGARIKALLRRSALTVGQIITYKNLTLNTKQKCFFIGKNSVKLTLKEFKLLKLLIKNPKRLYSREQIITLIWGVNSTVGNRAVDVFISRVRKTLQNNSCNLLQTVRGFGYKLSIDYNE